MTNNISATFATAFLLVYLIASVLVTEGFEPHPEFEPFTIGWKIVIIVAIVGYSLLCYLAGTEYHYLKQKLRE